METKKLMTRIFPSKINVEFTVEHDSRGFCVNVDVDDQEFRAEEISAYMLLVAKSLCRETGIDFRKLIQNALSMETSEWVSPVQADA